MRLTGVILMIVAAVLVAPGRAAADIEVTGVFGGLLGSDLDGFINDDFSLSRSFEDAPLFGARVSWFGPIIGVEGSYVRSNSGVSIDAGNIPVDVDASVSYLEANALISPIPGPFSPFFTAGIGTHSFDFDVDVANFGVLEESVRVSGFNFGGGLRVSFSRLVVRGEIRDHVTKVSPEDFDLQDIAEELGFNESQTLHNIEVSFGVGISF